MKNDARGLPNNTAGLGYVDDDYYDYDDDSNDDGDDEKFDATWFHDDVVGFDELIMINVKMMVNVMVESFTLMLKRLMIFSILMMRNFLV